MIPMSGIKDYDFVFIGIIEIFVKSQKLIYTKIRVHRTNSIEKYIRTFVIVSNGYVLCDSLVYIV